MYLRISEVLRPLKIIGLENRKSVNRKFANCNIFGRSAKNLLFSPQICGTYLRTVSRVRLCPSPNAHSAAALLCWGTRHYGMSMVLVTDCPGGGAGPNSGKSVPTIFHLL